MKMETPRFWNKKLVLAGVMGCALALSIATPAIVARPAPRQRPAQARPTSSALQTQTYEGMVTDTRCGAKHSAAIGMTAADCTRVCVHGGEQFALVDGDTVYMLEGEPAALKHVAGQRVRLLGTLNGNKISVVSVGVH